MPKNAALIGGFVASALAIGFALLGFYFLQGDREGPGAALFGVSLCFLTLAVALFKGKRWGLFTFVAAWIVGPLALVPWFGWWALVGWAVPLVIPEVTMAILELLWHGNRAP